MSENREEILADFQVSVKSSQYIALIVKIQVCDKVSYRKVL
jgi:hypothetical protein